MRRRARRWHTLVVLAVFALSLQARIVPVEGDVASAGALSRSASCPTGAMSLSSVGETVHQVVTVSARRGSTSALLSTWQRAATCFLRIAGPFVAQVGGGGLSATKVEGDETTPVGLYPIGATMFGVRPDPGIAYPYQRIVCGDWWDEDSRSRRYNRFVHLACGVTPTFGGDSEALWRIVPAYDYFAVIGYNVDPVISGRGSAIFLHVATGRPTAGCVALPSSELLRVLRWLRPAAHPEVALSLLPA